MRVLPILPSRPGEFHPEPLTDLDLTLSRHPARATARRPIRRYKELLEIFERPQAQLPCSDARNYLTHVTNTLPLVGTDRNVRF
jgi:hypothetical protein